MRSLIKFLRNILINKLFILFIINSVTTAQEVPDNLLYGHARLFFNDMLLIGNHKILWAKDKWHESKRKMYLLDNTNQIRDTMKCSAIEDIITLDDSTFLIWDLNYEVVIQIKDNRFDVKKVFSIFPSFENRYGLDILIDRYMIGKKYLSKPDCEVFNAAIINNILLPVIQTVPNTYEKKLYNLSSKDTITIITINCPHNIVLNQEQEKIFQENLKNINIKPFTLIDKRYTCHSRTREYYGWDNIEIFRNKLFLYEKNSCSVFVFDMVNHLKMKDIFILPVDNQSTQGWKYFFDRKSGKHFAVKRVIISGADSRSRRKEKVQYKYYIYNMDWKNKNLNFIKNTFWKPLYISEKYIYSLKPSKESIDIVFISTENN